MKDAVRISTGIIMIILGMIIMGVPFFVSSRVAFVSWIYGVPILFIGFFILFNENENEIEAIKKIK